MRANRRLECYLKRHLLRFADQGSRRIVRLAYFVCIYYKQKIAWNSGPVNGRTR